MKKLIIFTLTFLTLQGYSQDNIKIEMTESYELSNIILALTLYGRTDAWEVQKVPPYYNDIIKYFEPVKNHPLLDSVNYSRQKWEDYLSFRTDAYCFTIGTDNKLKRNTNFYTNPGHNPLDKNLDLVNDFITKSNFRQFYNNHKNFYQNIISNYKEFYFVNQSKQFLEKVTNAHKSNDKEKYLIVLSPLVYRMNCHRNIDSLTVVDFPSISKDLILGNLETNYNTRIVENHTLFTEMDHGYVNPISDKYEKLITSNFKLSKWDKQSGYQGVNNFNEYMTWAVYDLFIKEKFPMVADSIALQWQYQNASRGFIGQNLFAKKVSELYFKQKGDRKIENIYVPLLKWCKSIQDKVSQPTLLNIDTKNFVKTNISNIQINFSETMQADKPFKIQIMEFKDGSETGRKNFIELKNPNWTNEYKTLNLKVETEYKEFALVFNWWGNDKPLLSKNEILLQPASYIPLKK